MANRICNITDNYNVTLKIFGQKVIMPVFVIDRNRNEFNENDAAQIRITGINFTYTNLAGRYNSSETICNVNIGQTLTDTGNNKTFSFTRNSGSNFTYTYGYGLGSNTLTLSGSNMEIFLSPIIKTADGVYWGGDVRYGVFGGYSSPIIEYDYFQLISIPGSNMGYQYFYFSSSLIENANILLGKIMPTDPYADAGDSTTGGGGGTFDGSSDPVAVPALPSVGATNTGFISLFVPTQAQLKQVADYLWGGLFDLSTYLKIFENPMDCILGLSVVPVTVPTSGSANITVGNIELSGISLPLASQQYVEVDCGTISFTDKYFGSYLDQDPYTKMALFVPYSGIHSVKADDIMGKTVGLKYHIDILTGSLVAFLTCGDSVLYEFNGACASNIPVNSINYASTIENAIRIAVNIGTTVATAGAAAPMTGAETAAREAARTFGTAVNMAGSTAEGILSLKPNIDRAGSLGGTTGLMGNQKPYFIITRPRLCKPANQNTFKGYPSFIQVAVSDLVGEGYTEFDTIILAGLYLTDAEKEELQQILKSGVYL